MGARRWWRSVVLAAALAAAGLGCSRDDGAGASGSIATVAGRNVPREELDRRLAGAMRKPVTPWHGSVERLWRSVGTVIAQALIEGEWIEQEAAGEGIVVSGGRRRDEQRLAILQAKLLAQEPRSDPTPSAAMVRSYFSRRRSTYGKPEQRVVRLVLLDSRRAARRLTASVADGGGWRADAEPLRKYEGPLARDDGLLVRPLPRLVFEAPVGQVVGPVRAGSSWFTFEVRAVEPAIRATFRAARDSIAATLRDRLANAARDRWYARLKAKYLPRTSCAPDMRVTSCP